jgi:hypothetical protein
LDWKIEVSLATSPADPRRLTAAWIQGVRSADKAEVLGSATNMWATSTDGGLSWTKPQPVPRLTTCTGNSRPDPVLPGFPDWAADPNVSFGREGTAYLASVRPHPIIPMVCCGDVYSNRSGDGGLHWDAPVVVDAPVNGIGRNDPAFVTADPRIPGRAYLAWNHLPPFSVKFSSTTNGGASWSPGTVVEQDTPGHQFDLAPIVVMPDSSLLLFYIDYLLTGLVPGVTEAVMGTQNTKQVHVVHSTDGGRSWSAPTNVLVIPTIADRPSVAAAPDGSVYFAWADRGAGKVMTVRSADLGNSWTRPREVASKPGAQLATIAVNRHGTLGITWYDSRNPRPGSNADVWFAYSRDHGATWSETHLAGPFDLTVPGGAGVSGDNWPLGGYEGLVATPDGFAAAFVMAKPKAKTGPTDVFFARIRA